MNLLKFQSPADRSVYINPSHVVSVRRFKGNVNVACSNGVEHEVVGDVDEIGALLSAALNVEGPGIVDTGAFVLPESVSEADLKAALDLIKKDAPEKKDGDQQATPAPSNNRGRGRS